MNKGWISIHRKLTGHWLYDQKPYDCCHAWLDILLSVNHEDRKVLFDGKLFPVKAGQMITSLSKLSEKWGWNNRTKIRRFLELLVSDGMVDLKRNNNGTLLTVANWDFYQCHETQMKHSRNTHETDIDTNNNDNNENNDNKKNKGKYETRAKTREGAEVLPPGFAEFWTAYPKKVKKPDAIKAWKQVNGDNLTSAILESVETFKTSQGWTKDNGQFIPYPASWLRGKRWEDETGESESASNILRRMYEDAEREQGGNGND